MHSRKPTFTLPRNLPKSWIPNNPFMSSLFTSLSLLFPEGELLFCRSVRKLGRKSKDEDTFLLQEARHTIEHRRFNAAVVPEAVPSVDESLSRAFDLLVASLGDAGSLGLTCALEHATALLAETLLKHSDSILSGVPKDVLDMWLWHAEEELEHRAVAFNLYKEAHLGELMRVMTFLLATVMLPSVTAYLMYRHGDLSVHDVKEGLIDLFVSPGYITKLLPQWFSYLSPSFSP